VCYSLLFETAILGDCLINTVLRSPRYQDTIVAEKIFAVLYQQCGGFSILEQNCIQEEDISPVCYIKRTRNYCTRCRSFTPA
jgi:hypothetical protein